MPPNAVSKIERAPIVLATPAPLLPPEDVASRCAAIGAPVDASALTKLGSYLAHLLAMNEQMNLTAIKDAESAWERHVLDALTLLPHLSDVPADSRLADIGSGGGIPGIPIAVARPDLRVTLVEATQKKAAFLTAVSAALGLANVTVRAERAEVLAKSELRGTFDVVTARAVARLLTLVPLAAPLARPGGRLLLVKGERAQEELTEAAAVLAKCRARHVGTTLTPTGRIVRLLREG